MNRFSVYLKIKPIRMKHSPITLGRAFILLLTVCTFQSCFLFRPIVVEDDVVNSTSRIRTQFEYRMAKEWNSPLIRVTQNVLRETGKNAVSGIRIFDEILLLPNSFSLENRVYLLIDNKPFEAVVEDVQFQRQTDIREKRKDVVTLDSSKVSVVTGYDRSVSNAYKITYFIGPETVDAIRGCMKLQYRYYAGPDMITTTMSKYELNILKKVLATN